MAEAVVAIALEEIRDLLVEEGRLLSGVGNEVRELEKQLKEMKYLLEDADKRRHKEKTIANWIAEIRDLAYRAETAIESHAVRLASRRRRGLRKLLRRYYCFLKECYSLHQLGSEISHIKSELERITVKLQHYGIRRIIDSGESSGNQNRMPRRTHPDFEIGDDFVGREDELKHLHSRLVEDKQHRVISVWGMGGSGKTTIARKVYNNIKQSKSAGFDSFAWVCITQQCRARSVLEDILNQLLPPKRMNMSRSLSLSNGQQIPQKREDISKLSETELIKQLCEIQRDKRCLIVVDDLWKTSHWDDFKHPFLIEDLQSKILITTREEKVADIGFPLKLGLLNVEDAWKLLMNKAFPYTNTPDIALDKNLDIIGKEMVRKCGFLPLAVSVLGGVLRKKNSIMEWDLVNKNINAFVYRDEGDDGNGSMIDGVLNLSYENLPYYLKPCFLYLGSFKEDESIDVYHLYRIWIAQGMISHDNLFGKDETLMDLAELYLRELASRSIVEVEADEEELGRYKTCNLHDVIRKLCLKLGKKEAFGVQILDCRGWRFNTLQQEAFSHIKIRHLAIHFKREVEVDLQHDELTVTCNTDIIKHLRSLRILYHVDLDDVELPPESKTDLDDGESSPQRIDDLDGVAFPPLSIVDFNKFKFLRDLVIVGFTFAGRKLPRGITSLVHLRYLGLLECEFDELPSSLRNLVYLATLDLSFSFNVRVPNVLKKMLRLKHLLLPHYEKKIAENYRLSFDEGLEELESLEWLNTSVHELKSITSMKNLRRFTSFIHDNESLSTIMNAIATKWNKLVHSAVAIEEGCELISAGVEGLLKKTLTCPNLLHLGIHVELRNLLAAECGSTDFTSSKLVSLVLSECKIEDDPMGILGKLPSLKRLILYASSFVGEEMTCLGSSFPALKMLELDGLPNLREWRVDAGAMHLLSELHIYRSDSLEMFPDGLRLISTLETLILYQMPKLGERASPSGEDFYKISHVPSIIIY